MHLKDYKYKNRLTFRSLGTKLDIDAAQLVRYTNGLMLPSLKTAYKIYKATGKQVDLIDWFKKPKEY